MRALSESERYAYGWVSDKTDFSVRMVEFQNAPDYPADLLWWHGARKIEPSSPFLKLFSDGVADLVSSGVPLMLTGSALSALPALGLELNAPRKIDGVPYDGPVGDREIRGHMTFAGHPAFSAFGTGAYTWKPARGVEVWDAWYDLHEDQMSGRPVAVERRYISFDPKVVTALTYDLEMARVGAVGAHLPFHDRGNVFRGHMERLVEGWIRWLVTTGGIEREDHSVPERAGPFVYSGFRPEKRDRWWPVPDSEVVEEAPDSFREELSLDPLPPVAADALERAWNEPAPAGLSLLNGGEDDSFFDVTGRRHFMLGHSRGGLAEAWSGGVRLFRRCALSWIPEDGSALLLDDPRESRLVQSEVRLDGFRRLLRGSGEVPITVRQLLAAHGEGPGGLTLIEVDTPSGGVLDIELIADLRLMWPYPAGLLGPLSISRPAEGIVALRSQVPEVCGALTLSGPNGAGSWRIGENSSPDPSGETGIASARLLGGVDLPPGRHTILLAWGVGRRGMRPVSRLLDGIIEDPGSAISYARLKEWIKAEDRVQIDTPGRMLGEAFNWISCRMIPFHQTVDNAGRSFLAGFNVTGRDWLSGRPGYAWFFGRDAIFTALGSIAAGDFEAAHDVLTFLASHQEWTGKILHEATLSRAVHYDAADSTPLWLVLLGAWFRATGERAALSELWPTAKRALEFCRRTDSDGDGLIENTGVGHGWVEGGKLYGAHVTNYLAGVWAAALDAAALCADAMRDDAGAVRARTEAARTREVYEKVFWVEGQECDTGCSGYYAQGMMMDRTLQIDHTIMPTVPIFLGQTDPDRSREHLIPLAGNAFSADWGVRMVPLDHSHFDPEGYYHGSVWPLYTGWTALAEYRVHRSEAGLAHIQSNIATLFDMSPGSMEEALHGLNYESVGICPHQAWSHSATVQAVVEGLIGWYPDARRGKESLLSPHIPEWWEELKCSNLRVGDYRLQLHMKTSQGRRSWTLTLSHAGEGREILALRFSPAIPVEARIDQVIVDGHGIHAGENTCRDDRHVELDLELIPGMPTTVEIHYDFDFIPVIPPPQLREGSGSSHWRLVDRWWSGGSPATGAPPEVCRMILEGPSGSDTEIDCLLPGRRPRDLQGAEWVEPPRKGKGRIRVNFPADEDGAGYSTVAVLITFK